MAIQKEKIAVIAVIRGVTYLEGEKAMSPLYYPSSSVLSPHFVCIPFETKQYLIADSTNCNNSFQEAVVKTCPLKGVVSRS